MNFLIPNFESYLISYGLRKSSLNGADSDDRGRAPYDFLTQNRSGSKTERGKKHDLCFVQLACI